MSTVLQIRRIFIDNLLREPSFLETQVYTVLTVADAENALLATTEYKSLHTPNYTGITTYDTVDGVLKISDAPLNYVCNRLFMGNGKLGIIPKGHPTLVAHVRASIQGMSDSFVNSPVTWNTTQLALFSNKYHNTIHRDISHSLNTTKGILTSEFTIYGSVATSSDPPPNLHNIAVTRRMAPLRQYPFVLYQDYELRNMGNSCTIPMYHSIEHNEIGTDAVIFTDNVDGTPCIHIRGDSVICGETYKLYAACLYTLEIDGISTSVTLRTPFITDDQIGFWIELEGCVLNHGSTARLIVTTIFMSDSDNPTPDVELRRAIDIMRLQTPDTLWTAHKQKWIDLWQGNIEFEAKLSATYAELERLSQVRRLIRTSLFGLYSRVRDDVIVDTNAALGVMDDLGNLLGHGETFAIPLLLILNPRMARTLLDNRYYQLSRAKLTARSRGHFGATFGSYSSDTHLEYGGAYFDATGFENIATSALVGIHCWNYYRISGDNVWFKARGWTILNNVMRYVQSVVVIHSETDTTPARLTLPDENEFTKYTVFLITRCAIEATYSLNYRTVDEWMTIYNILRNMYSDTDNVNSPIHTVSESTAHTSFPTHASIRKIGGSVAVFETAGDVIGRFLGNHYGSPLSPSRFTVISDRQYTLSFGYDRIKVLDEAGNTLNVNDYSIPLENGAIYDSGYGWYGGNMNIYGSNLKNFGLNEFAINQNGQLKVLKTTDSVSSDADPSTWSTIMLTAFYGHDLRLLLAPTRISIPKLTVDTFATEAQNMPDLIKICLLGRIAQRPPGGGGVSIRKSYMGGLEVLVSEQQEIYERMGLECPWDLVFALVDGIFGARPSGSINNTRFLTEPYGIKYDTASVLPSYASTATLKTKGNSYDVKLTAR